MGTVVKVGSHCFVASLHRCSQHTSYSESSIFRTLLTEYWSTDGLNTVSTGSMSSTEGPHTASVESLSRTEPQVQAVPAVSNPEILGVRALSAVQNLDVKYGEYSQYIIPKYCHYSTSCPNRTHFARTPTRIIC